MKSNVPPGAAEDPTAPYNEQCRIIKVTISQTLSSTKEIELPCNVDFDDHMVLEQAVNEQIMLPSDCLETLGYNDWIIDDFCVI